MWDMDFLIKDQELDDGYFDRNTWDYSLQWTVQTVLTDGRLNVLVSSDKKVGMRLAWENIFLVGYEVIG